MKAKPEIAQSVRDFAVWKRDPAAAKSGLMDRFVQPTQADREARMEARVKKARQRINQPTFGNYNSAP